jgi:hypothetical protein
MPISRIKMIKSKNQYEATTASGDTDVPITTVSDINKSSINVIGGWGTTPMTFKFIDTSTVRITDATVRNVTFEVIEYY